jgi:CRP/FNR family transcriptional regulator
MGAFAERVTRRFHLDKKEIDFLQRLEASPVPVKRGQVIAEEGSPAEHAFVLMTGWVMSCTRFPDGSHQVRRLHFPGDLLAMQSVPMQHHAEDVEALSDSVIAPFPRGWLAELFTMPRLAAIMYMLAQSERITACDRLASLGHSSARARVAYLLLDVLHRLRSADPTVTSSFYMHLTREQVAQVAGMTPVHASRMWCALVREGLIACDRRLVTIQNEPALEELSQYRDRDRDLDVDWLRLVEEQVGADAITRQA